MNSIKVCGKVSIIYKQQKVISVFKRGGWMDGRVGRQAGGWTDGESFIECL